jgi:4-aminobutyrate aminotransferase-like enzyme
MDGEAALGSREDHLARSAPRSIAWANSFAAGVPDLRGPLPGPASMELVRRRNRHEMGSFSWVERMPFAFESGAGVVLTDADGNRHIDLSHGHMAASLGHGNPELADAIDAQTRKLMNTRNYPNTVRVELMERLAEITPGDLNLFAFYSSGTEAAEAAMRVARSVTGGHEFVSFFGDYHGKTVAAVAAAPGGSRADGPRLSGHWTVPGGYCHRCEFGLEPSTCNLHCVSFVERALRMNSHGALAGIIAEPITNASGARVYAPGYLKGLREVADRTGALLIFDEHATGVGRTGAWWAGDHEGVVPDIMFFGKYLGNGYPITAVAVSERYREKLAATAPSSTFGGQPAACAAALTTLNIIQRDNLVAHVAKTGAVLLDEMQAIKSRHPIIGAAQGKGFLLGFEIVDPTTGLPSEPLAWEVATACASLGVCVSPVVSTIRVSPMIVTSQAVALRALGIVEQAITRAEATLS